MAPEPASRSFFDQWKAPLLLLSACLFLFFFRLGSFGLLEGGESYYPAAVREMLEAHDWIVPHLNYQIYFSKPILTFWLIGSAYSLFGVNELAGRLWSAVLSVALVFVCYLTAKCISNSRAAFFAALILASSPLLIGTCRRSSIDVFFSFFLDSCICAIILVLYANRPRLWPFVYIALALAVLTKGPAALVLLALGVMLFCALRRPSLSDLRHSLRPLHPFYGIFLFSAIVLPWFAAIGYATNGLFLKVFLLYENLSRFAGHTNSKTPHFWWYLWTLLYGLFPWSVFLPDALRSIFRRPASKERPTSTSTSDVTSDSTSDATSDSAPTPTSTSDSTSDSTSTATATSTSTSDSRPAPSPALDALLLAGCCAIAMLVFFSLSRTQFETYVLPAWGPLALLLGNRIDRFITEVSFDSTNCRKIRRVSSPLIALCGIFVCTSLALIPAVAPQLPVWMQSSIAAGIACLALGWLGQFFLLRKSRILSAMLLLAASTTFGYGLLSPVLTELWYQNSFKDVQSLASLLSSSEDELAQYKEFMPSLLFYRKGSVDFFYHPEDLVPKSKANAEELARAPHNLYIIVRQVYADELAARPDVHLELVKELGAWRLYKTADAILRVAPTLEFTFKRLGTMDVLTDRYHWGPLTMPYSGGDFKRPYSK
ncbi:MAG TPA: glycosyltransferase family 39 protein [Chroococcales cyanobacterium]